VANIPPDYRREAGRLSPVSGGGVAVAQDRRWRRRAGTVRDASTDALIPRESAGGWSPSRRSGKITAAARRFYGKWRIGAWWTQKPQAPAVRRG